MIVIISKDGKPMRYNAEHKAQTRQKLLKVAASAIRAEGPHRVGVAGVMAKAGLTHGGFYAHFASKDELILAAIDTMFDSGRNRLANETRDRKPAAGLAAYVDFYLSAKHRDALGSGCPMAALASDLPRLDHAARLRFADGGRTLVDALAALLEQCGRPDAHGDASSMFAEMLGALSLARAETDPARSDAFLARSRESIKRRFALPGGVSAAVTHSGIPS
jgi:TetR/AcrR family transcriptional regulator, transcriptional repressor for nem operon